MLSLDALSPDVARPDYDRQALRARMVHIGFGAFHRGHQAVCSDRLASLYGSDWGYCEINLNSGELIQALKQQNYCYTVAEMADNKMALRVIGVVKEALHGKSDGINAVIEALAHPEVAIVSMTVTEKGYCYEPSSGSLDITHPSIVHDIAHPEVPCSVPGIILAGIVRRRRRHLPPFSVMSCDNMPENGQVTRNVILALAEKQSSELAPWIAENISFPSTMVDRIVPAMTDETHAALREKLGCDDPVSVVCEPFFQWVIEDNFVSGRPAWEKAGAELVTDVLPFEQMKLRMLNGSHSFLAYLGNLAGYENISDCMADKSFRQAALQLMLKEQAPTLQTKTVDLQAYANSLIARYENLAIRHRTAQIANDGSQKLPQRWLDSIRWHLKNGGSYDLLALGVAGWMRYVSGVNEQGETIEIHDPMHVQLAQRVAETAEGPERVAALLSLKAIFGEDLPAEPVFVAKVNHFSQLLWEKGAKEAVKHLLEQV